MDLVSSLILILSIIVIYFLIIQIFTVLFRMTGLTKEKARFQVISMLTNSGFTTGESEIITTDKKRRRLALACMLTGTAFNVIIVSLMINFISNISFKKNEDSLIPILIILGSFILIILFLNLPFVKRGIEKLIEVFANSKSRKNHNIITLLDVYGKDAIAEVLINILPEYLKDKRLIDCDLKNRYNLNVLMIKRNGRILDVTKDTIMQKNDVVVIFGSHQNIKDLFANAKEDAAELLDDVSKLNTIDLIDNYGLDAMAEVVINTMPDFLDNQPLISSGLKTKYNINVMMVKRNGDVLNVTKDTILNIHDVIVVFGPYKNIKDVFLNDIENDKEAEK